MSDFEQRYRRYQTIELLKIVDQEADYQPEAVKAAKQEIVNRALSDSELLEIKEELRKHNQTVERAAEERRKQALKASEIGTAIVDFLSPIQGSNPSVNRRITLVIFCFAGLTLYKLVGEFKYWRNMTTLEDWEYFFTYSILPIVLFLTILVLFWMRKKIGWILFVMYLIFNSLGIGMIFLITYDPERSYVLPPVQHPVEVLASVMLFSAVLLVICQGNVREQYKIDKKLMFIVSGVSAAIVSFGILIMFN